MLDKRDLNRLKKMNAIEKGVRQDIERLKIQEPYPALVNLAIEIARTLDDGVEEKNLASLSRELRLTLEQIGINDSSSGREADAVEKLMSKER